MFDRPHTVYINVDDRSDQDKVMDKLSGKVYKQCMFYYKELENILNFDPVEIDHMMRLELIVDTLPLLVSEDEINTVIITSYPRDYTFIKMNVEKAKLSTRLERKDVQLNIGHGGHRFAGREEISSTLTIRGKSEIYHNKHISI